MHITGQDPPSTPIIAQTYARQGLPCYDINNERLSGIVGDFNGVKSVADLDRFKHNDVDADLTVKEVDTNIYDAVVTLDHTGMLSVSGRSARWKRSFGDRLLLIESKPHVLASFAACWAWILNRRLNGHFTHLHAFLETFTLLHHFSFRVSPLIPFCRVRGC